MEEMTNLMMAFHNDVDGGDHSINGRRFHSVD
jgi:hypothetical protein